MSLLNSTKTNKTFTSTTKKFSTPTDSMKFRIGNQSIHIKNFLHSQEALETKRKHYYEKKNYNNWSNSEKVTLKVCQRRRIQ